MTSKSLRWLGAMLLGGVIQTQSAAPPGPQPPSAPSETEAALDQVQEAPAEGAEVDVHDAQPPVATDPLPPPGGPYEAIVIRNSFGLGKPPPPPPPAQEPTPLVNTNALKLTGITTLLGKRAMFVFNDGKTNRVSGLVREGEQDPFIPDLEVLEINPVARTVRVTFGGRELTMDFVKDGLMPPTNQVAVAGASAHGRPGTQVAMATSAQRPSGGALQPGIQPASSGGGTTSTGRTIPARPSRLGAGVSARPGVAVSGSGIGGGDAQAGPSLSPEQQNQLIREQVNFGQQINLEMPPVPPAPGLEDVSGPPTLPGGPPGFPPAPQ